ncbi:hypothetical protein [Sphingomonas colocasiae]|uniref:ABC transporter permease n=1 Tax=Sphingomonas colocasiae TaxID=1848973 RepID=A0ABS7PL27_9SPHN|nr:hypothetical protein [Sphingomonas colocasiae]MBY8821996.1 hypothetical protein [Sphingomonas colocasiae]
MMLAQAISGEAYRALRNPRALFWAYALVPLFILIFGLGIELAVRIDSKMVPPTIEPFRLAIRSLGAGGNPIAQLFYAIGAAALVANEYRWESWRLIGPRNRRLNLILAKFMVYLACAALSLAAIVAVEFFSAFVAGLAKGTPVAWNVDGGPGWAALAVAWAASLAELAALGALAMAGAVATRSLLGGAMPAFLFALGQSLLLAFAQPPAGINRAILLPVHAGDMARGWAQGGSGGDALAGAAMLLCWAFVLIATAIILFSRQDLSRE